MKRYEIQLKEMPIVIDDADTFDEAISLLKEIEIKDMKSGDWEWDKYIICDTKTQFIVSNAGYQNNYYRLNNNKVFCFVDDTNITEGIDNNDPLQLKGSFDLFNTYDDADIAATTIWNHLTSEERKNRKYFFIGVCKLRTDDGFIWEIDAILYDYINDIEYNLTPNNKECDK